MTTNVHFAGIEATDAIKEYAQTKVTDLLSYFDEATGADVHLGKETGQNKGDVFFAEIKFTVPNHNALVVKKHSDDLYKAIDKVKDHLKVEIEKLKGKADAIDREAIREQKAYRDDTE